MKTLFRRTIAGARRRVLDRLHPYTIDADGSHREALRAYIVAAITYREVRGVRIVFVYVLVSIGFLIWFASAWPDRLPDGVAAAAWFSWLAAMVAALLAGALEWIAYRNFLRCLSRLGGPFEEAARPAGTAEGSE